MFSLGHSLTGVAVGLVSIPTPIPNNRLLLGLTACAIAANTPDFRIPHWGHEEYAFSHSLVVTSAFILLLSLVTTLAAKWFKKTIPWKIYLAVGGAWMSHLLLDTFYNHGKGLKMFWPLSDAAIALPMPWFHNIDVHAGFFAWSNISEYISEFLFFSVVVLIAWVVRRRLSFNDSVCIECESDSTAT
jgi:membrane-bound metal-dependent hydrolase YbcI (DUF457 family)